LIPLFYKLNKKGRLLIDRINLRFGTVKIGVLIFAINRLLHVVTRYMPFVKGLDAIHPVEVKDCNLASLFFILAISIYRKERVAVAVPCLLKKFPGLKLKS